ncbi:protein phosphatase 1 regulatory subunit 1B-like isoform X1 [Poecilia latipinna]|uniref:Protein phosphatase 1 regulatory subunit 1B n=2 Tax=Poecilia TaxID=8080 RepID=A0A087X7A4_POEFO|nr:PREDICTED: protein phosphatase 1 regulatory subunit 1B-like isoform X1 [Poecilia formosa]XP_014847704.1 PREDICTED: protein phosphatase 1 regulatory subunit 1B-like isoform X1 [Poecilia mexicana]XP_014891647.1 PREDICTED: protein phosphatase 1 regulatory subunit 1B-like isoform X1 [Poecilia latipinna]
MDPLLPTDPEMMEREADKDARRKIQFSVPSSISLQLDPRQVEMIRRRRPTPATLFKLTDPPSPEEDSSSRQWVLGENGSTKAKLVHMATYQPPSLKAVQMLAAAHLKSLDREAPSSGEEEEQPDDEEKQQAASTSTDLREKSEPSTDLCEMLGSSDARAETTELEEEKGE